MFSGYKSIAFVLFWSEYRQSECASYISANRRDKLSRFKMKQVKYALAPDWSMCNTLRDWHFYDLASQLRLFQEVVSVPRLITLVSSFFPATCVFPAMWFRRITFYSKLLKSFFNLLFQRFALKLFAWFVFEKLCHLSTNPFLSYSLLSCRRRRLVSINYSSLID